MGKEIGKNSYHKTLQKCKRLKPWEMVEKLQFRTEAQPIWSIDCVPRPELPSKS